MTHALSGRCRGTPGISAAVGRSQGSSWRPGRRAGSLSVLGPSVTNAAGSRTPRESWDAGLRAGVPFAAVGFFLSLSFGVLAVDAGFPPVAAVVMSMVVFAGSAQFAAIAIIGAGGGVAAAVGAAALMNGRFLPMGVALAPSLPGGAAWRAAQGQAVVDSSWALANLGDGRFDRWFLFGCSSVQYLTWTLGTVAGVAFGDALGDPRDLGLDAIYPAFFLAILVAELKAARVGGGRPALAAAGGALVALLLVPLTPPGVPVLVASLVALVGLRTPAGAGRDPGPPDPSAVAIGEDVR